MVLKIAGNFVGEDFFEVVPVQPFHHYLDQTDRQTLIVHFCVRTVSFQVHSRDSNHFLPYEANLVLLIVQRIFGSLGAVYEIRFWESVRHCPNEASVLFSTILPFADAFRKIACFANQFG